MGSLQDLLDSILPNVHFDLGRDHTHDGQPSRLYASRTDEVVSLDTLRGMVALSGSDLQNAKNALLICPEEYINKTRDFLSIFVEDYVDPDTNRIGYSFPSLKSGFSDGLSVYLGDGVVCESSTTALDNFAKALIQASALAGSGKVETLLTGWKAGEPVRYHICAILNGITIDASFPPIDGAKVEALPFSTDKLPHSLPRVSGLEARDYLGRTVVKIDSEASPALFRPGSDYRNDRVEAKLNCATNFQTICQTLSLMTDTLVEAAFYWHDYLDLENIFPKSGSSIWHGSPGGLETQTRPGRILHRDFRSGVVSLSVNDESIRKLDQSTVGKTLETLSRPSFNSVRTATSRLMKSKNARDSLADQFVDLRMALESLYLKDFASESSGEMGFRLALFGAWFLGTDFQDRKRIRKTLRDAYQRASGAVHTGDVNSSPSNRLLLAEGQSLCQQGILKLLEEGFPEDWGDLILGAAAQRATL